MTPGRTRLDEIVRGLDGVTDGPWRPSTFGFQIVSDFPEAAWQSVVELRTIARTYPSVENEMKSQEAIANHLARCSPDAIREIAAYVRELEARATAAEATVTALREALGVPEWQPIETAPKDGTVVYLWNKKAGVASKNIRWVVEEREGNKHPNCIMDGWKTDDMDAWGCLVPDQFSHWMLPWELPGPAMKGPEHG